jgi:DNA helicase-2/ATP-dependent DNA helicase PcrA
MPSSTAKSPRKKRVSEIQQSLLSADPEATKDSGTVFEREYLKLNPEQRLAVETIEGPVMVVAGPGTGKTQVVGMRVANILKRTQLSPRNILCLTYSTSGSTAMRERLRHLIGPDAYAVTIETIHGFCNSIIAGNPHVFETWANLEMISEVERFRVINKILDDLLPDLVLVSRKSPHSRTKDILSRISEVKREGKSVEELRKAADLYDIEMEGASKAGTKAHEKNVLSAKKFREFIAVFEKYQENLVATQRYDFEDMILHVIKALEQEEMLLARLQERYQYVLVDEFQDTNGAQYRLIELLTTYASSDAPNLFVVGDDDQAIYRFQGANLQNILAFRDRFPSAPIVTLTTSYRCTQSILDAAGRLIARNDERLVGKVPGLTKDLKAGSGEAGQSPMLVFSPSDTAEPWIIAQIVQEHLERGTKPNEIAILTQTNGELRPIYDVLRARGVPVRMDGVSDLLGHPLVLQAISLLQAVHNPEESAALAAALSCECMGCHPSDIARLSALRRECETNFLGVLQGFEEEGHKINTLPLLRRDRLIESRNFILELHQNIPNRTPLDTLERLLKGSGLLPTMSKQPADSQLAHSTSSGQATRHSQLEIDPLDFAALQAFFDYVKYRCYEQIGFVFESLLSDLKMYQDPDNALRMSYVVPHMTQEGVQLLTAHRSKGLEFDVVILPNFREGQWDKRRNPPSLSVPESLLYGWESDQKKFEQSQDERRVAFVAMTRARNHLYFTCSKEQTVGRKAKALSPSCFFAEAGPLPEREDELKDAAQASILLLHPVRKIDAELRAYLLERLKAYRLSVTSLNRFLEDPRAFLEFDLLEMPQTKKLSMVYGNAVHAALRLWGLSLQEGHPLELERFVGEFQNYLVDREILTEAERRNLIAQGDENLPRYFAERRASVLPFVHKVEYPYSVHVDDIPLKGKIDRIDIQGPDSAIATIIDFKTGKPKSESQIRELGYHRQLTFYALLLEKGDPLLKPSSYVLDFVGEGSEHPIERSFVITQDDKKELLQVIKDAWTKITALDFTPL